MSRQLPVPIEAGEGAGIVIKIFLVNGESRSLRINNWSTVTDILRDILPRLRVNMEMALDLFGIQFRNSQKKESYWLQPGYPVLQLVHEYSTDTPVAEWQFLLQIRILPKTPQHISEVDSISFQYFYDQVLHKYLSDHTIVVDNDMAVKLGCLELRRFFKDMPHAALKKKENFTMLEKEIGLEKFFKKSLLASVRSKKQLRTMVLNAFKEYEHVSTDICMFKFFNLLSKYHYIDEDMFTSCAVGNSQALPLTSDIFVGPNCNIEYKSEGRERRYLAAFSDIQGIAYESELMSRGKIILELRNNPAVSVRTALLVTAIDLASLIDSYCIVYTDNPHSRLTGIKRFSNSQMSDGLYNTIDELRLQQPFATPSSSSSGHAYNSSSSNSTVPLPYSTFRSSVSSEFSNPDLSDLDQYEVVSMREYRTIPPQDLMLGERIGEGQFGDVHSGLLYPKTMDETEVAIKTCKADASAEDKDKFLEEASVMCKFKHPNIIKLFGVVSHFDLAYIVMELAPRGQLRRYLLLEGSRVTRLVLLDFIAQVASAMVHLEDMNYVHRDIAARNVLVCNPQTIKLADFGLSRGLEDGDYYVASRGKLPIKWMAPESINFRRFTGLSDVWMFGVCAWEILMRGVKPFVGIKNDAVISKIEMGERLALPVECPAPLYALMNLCWKYDPLERPRFLEIEAGIREIIEEEIKLEEMSYRRSYHRSPIEPDPLAPPKAPRNGGGRGGSSPVARVSSNSSNTSRLSHSNDAQLMTHMTNDLDNKLDLDHTPPLPPRAMERFRDLSASPPSLGDGGGRTSPTPFKRIQERDNNRISQQPLPPPPSGSHPHPHPITPYSITTISAKEDSEGHLQRSESPGGGGDFRASTAPIPPPAILSQHPNHHPNGNSHTRGHGDRDPGIYYSTPPEVIAEKRQHRVLTKDGVFVSQDISSLGDPNEVGGGGGERDHGLKPKLWEGRPISHASTEEGSSGRSSPAHYEERNMYPADSPPAEESFVVTQEDDILKNTTEVVKAIKELSDKVHKSKPNDYIELVKNVGLALRDLLGKVDESLSVIPPEFHSEVLMAQKILSSDMNHLVEAMKHAQTHYDRFLEQEYQKKMLKAAHVVAVNSKLLLDAVNTAKKKARLMR